MELSEVNKLLQEIKDPEVPVISILELGVVRGIEINSNTVVITITPTYSGCPAMQVIEDDIVSLLKSHGVEKVEIKTVLSPAWTTDWITEAAKLKLIEYGIAPPNKTSADKLSILGKDRVVACPLCKSQNTEMISQFGSTACKALFKCTDCLEPFDYFKCL